MTLPVKHQLNVSKQRTLEEHEYVYVEEKFKQRVDTITSLNNVVSCGIGENF